MKLTQIFIFKQKSIITLNIQKSKHKTMTIFKNKQIDTELNFKSKTLYRHEDYDFCALDVNSKNIHKTNILYEREIAITNL